MKTIPYAVGSFLFVAFFASGPMAQGVQRTFVSGLGNDGNPCSRTAPCRTFAQAISQTNSSGEVYVLDSAGYAAFTITKPVSVIAPPGVTAGISVFSGTAAGITITTGSSDTVILRGLTINNQGSLGNGISFNNLGTLHVENCVVNGFASGGTSRALDFAPASSSAALEVKDSIFRGNDIGIFVLGGSAAIEQVRLELDSNTGVVVGGGQASIRNSLASGCGAGFHAVSFTSSAADLEIESCAAFGNSDGVLAESESTGVATVRISNSTVTHNVHGLNNIGSPAVLLSRGNNTVEGNGTNTMGTIGSYTAK